MIAVVPPEVIAFGVAVVVILVIAGGVALLVARYGATKKDQGGADEKVEALTNAIVEADSREEGARKQRAMSHAEWKRQGAKRRKQRARTGRGSK